MSSGQSDRDWLRCTAGLGFGLARPTSHAKITGVDGSKRAVRDALAQLEEQSPDEAALLQEHLDVGKSTDPRWED